MGRPEITNEETEMITIQQVRMADCDRATDDEGNYTDDGWQYVVCHDNDISRAVEWCDSMAEAERVARETHDADAE